jgi:hypothetical protein
MNGTRFAIRMRAAARHRVALAVLGLALCATAQAREWTFDVTLDGLPIGTHRFVLVEEGGERRLTSDARFRVRLLIVDAYSYDHHAEEAWRGDCLVALDSRTIERGKTTTVRGRLADEGFVVDSARGRENAGACPMTFAYWNPRIFEQHALLNPQTGAVTPVTVKPIAHARVTAHGAATDATGFHLQTEKTGIEVFYAKTGEWIGMRSTTREGHVLDYRLR